jgi:hypothetical protein
MRRFVPLLFIPLLLLLPARADAVTVRDIVELTHAGLGEDVLLALIEVDRSIFPIDAATIKELKAQGVSERVILAMVRSGRDNATPEPTTNDAPPPAPAPDPQVIVIDHHDPEIREVPVAVPVYIPVVGSRVHAHTQLVAPPAGIPISSDLWVAQHTPGQSTPVRKAEPVYWGFGGKLRPDAWRPAPDPSIDKTPVVVNKK